MPLLKFNPIAKIIDAIKKNYFSHREYNKQARKSWEVRRNVQWI